MKKSLFFFSFLLSAHGAFAGLPQVKQMIAEMEEEMDTFVGGAVAVIFDNKLIYKKAFGHCSNTGAPIHNDTYFSLASVSKAIVATAMGALKQKGVVNFNDYLKVEGQTFALREILSHTTGYTLRGDLHIEQDFSSKDLRALLRQKTKENYNAKKPYLYSNLLYSLSEDYLLKKGYSFDRLLGGLGGSFKTISSLPLKSMAYPCAKSSGKPFPFPSKYQKVAATSAGVLASLNGMTTFLNIALGNRPEIINQKNLDQLFAPVKEAHDVFRWTVLPFEKRNITSSYGLGWRRLALKDGSAPTFVYHPGFIKGVSCFVGLVPSKKAGIVILLNQNSRFAGKSGFKFWKAVATK